ncbi:helix-turn-helix domain-containing protein [Lentzea sp. NBRC 102530]|uniref:helix-turn-helix domain-containing protein n=1 Tax=Lentzea sp. NBRC 102530 TaxID=3032201 RepID=UPI0025573A85|nr:helix-turn-helix domain-containing protein [Lentzea sp. NBRC 102530]
MATSDLLLHPVRMRIVQALLDGRPSTTTQLRQRLPEIAPATMYRHVAVLADAGVLEVLEEKRVRGIMERTYRLHADRARLTVADRAAMTPDDHRQAFTTFAGSLLSDFGRYLERPSPDPAGDGVTYQQAALWLTDEEHEALLAEVRAAITARAGGGPGEGRTRRVVSLVAMPADEE